MGRRARIALYGNVAIPRGYCSICRSYSFIINGKLACCGELTDESPEGYKRMSSCPSQRKGPSARWKEYILRHQRQRCFYCDRSFGSRVFHRARAVYLRVQWDHVNPFAYSLDNRDQNFVATCHICNLIKSSLIFRSADEARVHIRNEWEAKGYADLSSVRIEVRPETSIAKVLPQKVPPSGLV